jgi:hypothetical protein
MIFQPEKDTDEGLVIVTAEGFEIAGLDSSDTEVRLTIRARKRREKEI